MGHLESQGGRAGCARRATQGLALVLIVAQLAGIHGAVQGQQQEADGASGVLKGRPAWRTSEDAALPLSGRRFYALRETTAAERGQGKRSLQEEDDAPTPVTDGTSSPTEGSEEDGGTSTPQGTGDTPAPVDDTDTTPSPVDDGEEGSTTPAPFDEEGTTLTPSQNTETTPSPSVEGEPPVGGSPAPTEVAGTGAPFAPSQCSNGIPGVSDGTVCCLEACGLCGGEGCGAVVGTNGASDCCPSTIIEEAGGEVCGEAPCVMEGFTPSPVNPAFDGTVAPFDASTCSNGIPGYQDGDICCLESCGQCGGAGCGTMPGTGGAANCCPGTILESGVVCGEAPCIIEGFTPAPAVVGGGTSAPIGTSTCSNGILGFQDGAACCAANCGQCGGAGCGAISGTAGSAACCSSVVLAEGESCDATNESPCVIQGYTPAPVVPDFGSAAPVVPSQCSNGMPGYQDLDVCCLEACGQCGGEGCGTIPGTGGSDFCCSTSVRETGQMCGNGVEPPCIMGGFTPSPVNPAFVGTASPVVPSTCSNGLPGVQNGAACCKEFCGQCGGVGCGSIPGTGGSSNCCASTVLLAQAFCGNGVEAPCVIQDYTPAPAGVPGVAAPFAASICTNGFAGVQNDNVCCDESCGQCGGEGCGAIPGTAGPDACCSTSIAANGTACQISGAAPCIITDWVSTPSPFIIGSAAPVIPSTCNNGLAGYQDENICCKLSCGLCGGDGCSQVPGTAGAADCCPSVIFDANKFCGGQVVAPCIVPFTPAPTMAPATTPVPTPTPFLSGNANEFTNSTSNAAESRLQAPVGMVPFVASLAAFLGALAFTAHHSGRGEGSV